MSQLLASHQQAVKGYKKKVNYNRICNRPNLNNCAHYATKLYFFYILLQPDGLLKVKM
jgi:hypothetical protein